MAATDAPQQDHAAFFAEFGRYEVKPAVQRGYTHGPSRSITVEELYQQFKARMLEELKQR
jgi:hypothetical protein